MHSVDRISVLQVVLAPLGEELLANQGDEIFQIGVLSKLPVLSGVENRAFNLVGQRTNHRLD